MCVIARPLPGNLYDVLEEYVPTACFFCRRLWRLHREIWIIMDERERVDAIDEQEGQKVQDMVRDGGSAILGHA